MKELQLPITLNQEKELLSLCSEVYYAYREIFYRIDEKFFPHIFLTVKLLQKMNLTHIRDEFLQKNPKWKNELLNDKDYEENNRKWNIICNKLHWKLSFYRTYNHIYIDYNNNVRDLTNNHYILLREIKKYKI